MSISPVFLRVRISSVCASQVWNGCVFPFACSERTTQRCSESSTENASTVTTSTTFMNGCLTFSQYNSGNSEPLFVPGGSAMRILVPWKPVVLVWGLLSGMIFVGFVASSVLQGKDPFAPGATIGQPINVKAGAAQAGQQPKHSHKAVRTPNQ